jgi:NADH:ubiquinone oxidoreductase subunit 5 (subunit L)/multisubunit Na+/H+ antiporter MnhA subunit
MITFAVAAPALSLVLAELLARRVGLAGRICLTGVTLAFAAAVGLLAQVLIGSQAASGAGPLALHADRLTVAMLLLVLGVSALAQAYALRNLAGSPQQRRFIRTTALTTSAVALTVSAEHLLLLLVGWELTSLGLLAIVGQRRELPLAREGLGRAARSLLLGDGALLLAGALIWRSAGDASLVQLHRVALALAHAKLPILLGTLPAGPCVAALLTVAAAARAAQLPGQSWLAATVTTPTPASAMLHAGLVNAGGFLLVRLAPVFADGPTGPVLAVTIGLATAIYGGTLSLSRPDVKGSLAQSTSAQMGFMLMACGLGAYAAAIVHLIGHGLYKASAFLGADGAVAAQTAKRRAPALRSDSAPPRGTLVAVAVLSAGAMAAALASFAQVALADRGAIVPLAFAWAAAVTVSSGLLTGSRLPRSTVLILATAASIAYAGLLALLTAYLHLAAGATYTLPLTLTLPIIALAFLAAWTLTAGATGLAGRLRARLYPYLLDRGSVRVRPATGLHTRAGLLRPAEQPARLSEQGAAA